MPAISVVRFGSFVVGLTLAACGGGSAGPSQTLSGNWRGSASGQGVVIQISFALSEAGTILSGNGAVSGNGVASCAPAVSGSQTGMTVSLTFTCQGFNPLAYSGTVASSYTTITGTMAGSGFAPLSMDIIKQ